MVSSQKDMLKSLPLANTLECNLIEKYSPGGYKYN